LLQSFKFESQRSSILYFGVAEKYPSRVIGEYGDLSCYVVRPLNVNIGRFLGLESALGFKGSGYGELREGKASELGQSSVNTAAS
jgi:hypothetical protein